MSGNFPGNGHSITNFARALADKDVLGEFAVVSSDWIAGFFESPALCALPRIVLKPGSIVHIGNNIESLPLMLALRESPSCVVVLHDLWVPVLADGLGRIVGEPRLMVRAVWKSLGRRGLRLLSSWLEGATITPAERMAVFVAVLRATLPAHHFITSHRTNWPDSDLSAVGGWRHSSVLDLPPHYSAGGVRVPQQPPRFDFAVRDSSGHWKRTRVVHDALLEVAKVLPLRIGVVGEPLWWNNSSIEEVKKHGGEVRRVGFLNNSQWDALHSQTRIGVRLGVGQLGECSGLVRDYVSHGMSAITDDLSGVFCGHPQVKIVHQDIRVDELASVMCEVMASPPPVVRDELAANELKLAEYWGSVSKIAMSESWLRD